MNDPSNDFRPASLPPDGIKIAKGCFRSENSKSQPVFWLLFNADPSRDAAWEADGNKNSYSKSAWRREQWIDFQAGGGELALRDLLERRWKEIVIDDPNFPFDPTWTYGAGLDWGDRHPTAFTVTAIDLDGCKYAVSEHRASGLTPATHTARIKGMRLPCIENGIRPLALSKIKRTYFDPAMKTDIVSANEMTSIIKMFFSAGFPHLSPGVRGQDNKLVQAIREAWEQPEVKFRIFCPKTIGTGTDMTSENGCPNLLWELMNLRYVEYSQVREQSVGVAEKLVDRDNDSTDSLKYWWTSDPSAPIETTEQQWAKQLRELKSRKPDLDLNSMIAYRAKFEREQPKKVLSYR